ncbi:formimidoylglutamase [Chryseobacterium salipaludis]|uniref:formimidoylglutamase n=1 Tax=Chryseobacterium TaxID=59732 RepID=UPI001FF6631F|nr:MULTISPECIES: formimidoylglutamase [Chryseobacterium]MCJ8498806.1 formimidoylglutamase [Chryseobacterium salipaludis]MCX3297374.1 formimidoylglutamase [Planobacterium sp. JC490]
MIWKGRYDGDDVLHHRLFQRVITGADYRDVKPNDFVLHGFAVDEGVRRNKGRVGAAEAPDIIRANMANFPVVQPNFVLCDFGNVECVDQQLEESQESLAKKVGKALSAGARSIVVGGGHEVMHAHFSGLRKAYPHKKIGIINFDAHFDNRSVEPNVGPSSGTGFWQIAQQETLHSLHIGIQRNSNTLQLFDTAHQLGMQYILADELFFENLPSLYTKVDEFLENVDVIYITICMDVFNAAVAPGVSAAAYNGIFADAAFMHLYRHLLSSTKVRALDVAEVNPSFDIQNQTARLAASLVNEWLMI